MIKNSSMSSGKFDNDSDDSDTEQGAVNIDNLPPLEIGANEHRLQYSYCLWYTKKGAAKAEDYSKALHLVGRCATVEQWWQLYTHLVRPSGLKPWRELSLFKHGVKPMWEDPSNAKGGSWMVRLKKSDIDRAWENLCIAMLGEQFLVGPEICGVRVVTTAQEDIISIWNRTATDQTSTVRIRDTLRRVLNLWVKYPIEYKVHCDSLKYVKTTAAASAVAATPTITTLNDVDGKAAANKLMPGMGIPSKAAIASAAAAAAAAAATTSTAGGGSGGGGSGGNNNNIISSTTTTAVPVAAGGATSGS